MNQILLIGELGALVRSIHECICDNFSVQLCSEDVSNIKAMTKIVKPKMIIVCQIGVDEVDSAIFAHLKESCVNIPVLIITTSEIWLKCKRFCEGPLYDKVFRPVGKEDLIVKCNEMLQKAGSQPESKAETVTQEEIETKSVRRSDPGPKKILIVDDSPLVLRNIKSILDTKYRIYLATSGEQGLAMAEKKQPDLILLDYEMPGMDGKDTFEALKEKESTKDIPVVFLSAIAGKEQIYAVLKSIPQGYILKPPDKEKLFAEIQQAFTQQMK